MNTLLDLLYTGVTYRAMIRQKGGRKNRATYELCLYMLTSHWN